VNVWQGCSSDITDKKPTSFSLGQMPIGFRRNKFDSISIRVACEKAPPTGPWESLKFGVKSLLCQPIRSGLLLFPRQTEREVVQ